MTVDNSSSTSKQREQLPVEVYAQIIIHLDKTELSRVLRVSSQLYHIACPLLYTSLDVDMPQEINPFTCLLSNRNGPQNSSLPSNIRESSRSSLPDRLSYVKYLTLRSHWRGKCGNAPSPHMPSLQTLRIQSVGLDLGALQLCACKHGMKGKSCSVLSACSCPLIARLRPSHLIIGGLGTGLLQRKSPIWSTANATTPEYVEHIGIIIGMGVEGPTPPNRNMDWLRSIPTNVKHLTFVLWKWDPLEYKDDGDGTDRIYPGEVDDTTWQHAVEPDITFDFDNDLKVHARLRLVPPMIFTGGAKTMEIVGFEADLPPKLVKAIIEILREEVMYRLIAHSWIKENAKRRAESIIFTRGEDYLATEQGENESERRKSREFREKIQAAVLEERMGL